MGGYCSFSYLHFDIDIVTLSVKGTEQDNQLGYHDNRLAGLPLIGYHANRSSQFLASVTKHWFLYKTSYLLIISVSVLELLILLIAYLIPVSQWFRRGSGEPHILPAREIIIEIEITKAIP